MNYLPTAKPRRKLILVDKLMMIIAVLFLFIMMWMVLWNAENAGEISSSFFSLVFWELEFLVPLWALLRILDLVIWGRIR